MVRHGRFSPLWLIPIVATALVIYLTVHTLSRRGATITLTFKSAEGMVPQQTQIRYKDVTLGTVDDLELSPDMSQVIVHVKTNSEAKPLLTDHARFWVVRPRFGAGGLTGLANGLQTLVSGVYIQVDPGPPGGKPSQSFIGLEDPPGVRSDQPGKTFVLSASHLGSLSAGAPVFFRDVNVGEMLSYDIGDGRGPVSVSIFVKAPYDKFVHPSTRFWNASGLSVGMGAEGLHVELESLQALLSGGIEFETSSTSDTEPSSDGGAKFKLYDGKANADAAQYTTNYHYVTYFETSIEGLTRASSVQIFGVQVGTVRDAALVYAADKGVLRARVTFDIQPDRVTRGSDELTPDGIRGLVGKGLRVVLVSSNLLTGEKVLSLQYVPGAKKAEVEDEEGLMVLPSRPGGARRHHHFNQRHFGQDRQHPVRRNR